MRGRLDHLEVDSAALGGNALGEPARRPLWVYLPPGYDGGQARYPVAYFLHPFMSSGPSWLNTSMFAHSVPERLDGLIDRGDVPPMLAVFPDGGTRLGGTQWNNSPAVGRYQDYLCQDVLPRVDASYRTVATAAGRAVLGRSSGGYGALLLGRDRPELFGHVAASAADSFFEYCYLPDFPKAAGAFLKAGGYEAWYRDFLRRAYETKMRGEDFPAINTLAMAASYSPKRGAPLGLELPFEPTTARLLPDVFARWTAEDPARFVTTHGAAFRKVKTVFLDAGARDEFNMRWGMRMVAQGLKAQQVEVVHEEFDDGHSGTNYRFDRALAVLGPRLARG